MPLRFASCGPPPHKTYWAGRHPTTVRILPLRIPAKLLGELRFRGAHLRNSMSTQNVLTSWKEIAVYLGKGVRTVQRWETELGLPVRRPNPGDRRIVIAIPLEIDSWVSKKTARKMTPRTNFAEMQEKFQRMQDLLSVMNERMRRVLATLSKFDKSQNGPADVTG